MTKFEEAVKNFHLGIKYLEGGQLNMAETYLSKAIKLKPRNSQFWYNYGVALNNNGKYDAALDAYLKCTSIKKSYYTAWMNMSGIYANVKNDLEKGLEAIEYVIKHKPKLKGAYTRYISILRALERYDEAEQEVRKAIKLNPYKDNLWLELMKILKDMGRMDESKEALEEYKRRTTNASSLL